ncbi:hypothetical protein E2P81_ATG06595 [Venturia nashicola]|uniref:Uncharacterized protein n=1 Tax=Venturia nashicola TaxID=86259 RepID=A0A4Z1NXC2_9PEZI|nr:hypothetical protein E6O75_ATG06763 [Venturia nashicola]TLD29942.1 hypothetical protein E2P81_ATG06595 [Venturia nashicola]
MLKRIAATDSRRATLPGGGQVIRGLGGRGRGRSLLDARRAPVASDECRGESWIIAQERGSTRAGVDRSQHAVLLGTLGSITYKAPTLTLSSWHLASTNAHLVASTNAHLVASTNPHLVASGIHQPSSRAIDAPQSKPSSSKDPVPTTQSAPCGDCRLIQLLARSSRLGVDSGERPLTQTNQPSTTPST